jgi:hypothetical protein
MNEGGFTMLETAVLGVIGSGRIGQCQDCHAAAGGSFSCGGFGPGCFLPRGELAAPFDLRAPGAGKPAPAMVRIKS